MHKVVGITDHDLMRGQPIPLRSPLLGDDSEQPAVAFDLHRDARVYHRVENVVEVLRSSVRHEGLPMACAASK